jgi:hypothetical protein
LKLDGISSVLGLWVACGAINDSARSATSETCAGEGRNCVVSCRIAVWCPASQHLWLTGTGEGAGWPCPWQPAGPWPGADSDIGAAPERVAVTKPKSIIAQILWLVRMA